MWQHAHGEDRLPPLAQEGDGYGLAYPGWLEDEQVPRQLAELHRRCDSASSPTALLSVAAMRRDAQQRAAAARLRRCPAPVAARFGTLLARAQSAGRVIEGHAPLMHAHVTYQLRRLVMSIG